jgi:DNA repair exonuclease SbcCD ATPase subunit
MTEELPEDRQRTVEAGLALFQQVQNERDRLQEELREAKELCTRARVEIESLHQLNNMLESHIQSYMMQRDAAIARRAELEVVVKSIRAQLEAFEDDNNENKEPGNLSNIATHIERLGKPAGLSDAQPGTHPLAKSTSLLARPEPVLGQPEPTPPTYFRRPSDAEIEAEISSHGKHGGAGRTTTARHNNQ